MRENHPESLGRAELLGRADLRQRLDALPAGHPSSPREMEAAGRRQPTELRRHDPELHDDADRRRPYTDAEWADHVTEVRTKLEIANADGLATDRLYAIDEDGEAWEPGRRAIHRMIIEDILTESKDVPCEYKAIVAGGLAGAGKTTVLTEQAGIDRSRYLIINPDDIKLDMAKRGLVPSVEGLSPMEASDLVHEESSHIAKQLAIRARAEGMNIIWDITMSSRTSTQRRIDDLRASGYSSITGIFVDIPIDLSVKRADARHRDDQNKYLSGDGLGGRYVPPEVTFSQADSQWGSHNRRTFEELKSRFNNWTLFDNSADGQKAIMVEKRSDTADSEEATS
jgi:predicted ABC-type ATPase